MEARGFTLLELIIALGIVTILGAILIWSAREWAPDYRLDAATRQVVLDLRATRARAIARRESRRLLFAPEAEAYRRQRRPGQTYEDDGPWVPLPPGVDLVDCTANGKAIGFVPRGTASTFGTVTLQNTTGRRRRVIVDIVGRLRVE